MPTDQELLSLAMSFWRTAEAPSDDDVETVFLACIRRDEAVLRSMAEPTNPTEE